MNYDQFVDRLFVELPARERTLSITRQLANFTQSAANLEARKKSWRSGVHHGPELIDLRAVENSLNNKHPQVLHALTGLVGELGEVVQTCSASIGAAEDHMNKVANELGDALFYLTALAHQYGWKLDDIVRANVKKLSLRFPDGYTVEAAETKRDEK